MNFSVLDYELPSSSTGNLSILNDNRKTVSNDVHKSETILIRQKEHKNKDDLIKVYQCDICKTTFHKRSLIIKHFKTSVCFPEIVFVYSCNDILNSVLYCNGINNTKKSYKRKIHKKSLEKNKSMKNVEVLNTEENNLPSKFKSIPDGVTHCVRENDECKCKTCGENFANLLSLKDHKCILSENNSFICGECYLNICDKENDKIIHTYSCHICHKQFFKQSSLTSHKGCHSLIKSSNQQSSELSVSKHISKIHALPRKYECSRCSRNFHTRSQIISHLFGIHKEDYSKKSCKTCSKLCECPQEFILHEDKKLIKCEICPRLLTTPHRLHQHYKFHLGINDFNCEFCSEIFFDYSSYLLHEQTHTGEKPFRCNFCSEWFPATSSLNIHLRSSKKKPFKTKKSTNVLNHSSNAKEHKIQGISNDLTNSSLDKFDRTKVKEDKIKTQTNKTNKNKIQDFDMTEEIECDICMKVFETKSQVFNHIIKDHF